MNIKNLAQLKRAIQNKTTFIILKHYVRPEYDGQIRTPNVVQTNGFYSVVQGDPANKVSTANFGKGSWVEYGKATDWEFDGKDTCTLFSSCNGRSPVWTIKFLDKTE